MRVAGNIVRYTANRSREIDRWINAQLRLFSRQNNMPVQNRARGIDHWVVRVIAIGQDRVKGGD